MDDDRGRVRGGVRRDDGGERGARGPRRASRVRQAQTLEFNDPTGTVSTYSDNAKVMLKPNKVNGYPFFTSLGTNGRACIHCHTPQDGWGISAADIRFRFTNPLNIANSNCLIALASCPVDANPANDGLRIPSPHRRRLEFAERRRRPSRRGAPPSTCSSRRGSFASASESAGAEFWLVAVDNPYGFASATQLSLFRRPLPRPTCASRRRAGRTAAATPVLTTVMWDGRETLPGHDIISDLMDQANGATLGHAQAIAGLSASDLQAIVDFETGLHTAQEADANAGDLTANGGNGGANWLSGNQAFYPGINDVLKGDSKTGTPFNPNVFTIYSAWAGAANAYQAQIARGEALFNTKPIAITGVAGLNDTLGVASIPGSCTSCHDSPNYGHHSAPLPSTSASRTARAAPRTCRSTRCKTTRPAPPCRSPIRGARSSPVSGPTSASSRGRSSAASRRARRTSTTARRRRSPTLVVLRHALRDRAQAIRRRLILGGVSRALEVGARRRGLARATNEAEAPRRELSPGEVRTGAEGVRGVARPIHSRSDAPSCLGDADPRSGPSDGGALRRRSRGAGERVALAAARAEIEGTMPGMWIWGERGARFEGRRGRASRRRAARPPAPRRARRRRADAPHGLALHRASLERRRARAPGPGHLQQELRPRLDGAPADALLGEAVYDYTAGRTSRSSTSRGCKRGRRRCSRSPVAATWS